MFEFFKKRGPEPKSVTPPPLPAEQALAGAQTDLLPLEQALAMRSSDSVVAIFEMIDTLAQAELHLLLSETDPGHAPLVLTGGDGQPMLAAFTQPQRAAASLAEFPGHRVSAPVKAVDIVGRLSGEAGLLINLRDANLMWVVPPDFVKSIRDIFAESNLLPPTLPSASSPKFCAGQVWTFHGEALEPDARLTVLQIDRMEAAGINVIHVAVTGLQLPNGGTTIGHMPFAEEALDRSIASLVSATGPVPDYKAGYEQWRWGRGGFFTVTVQEAINGIRTALTEQPSDS